MGYGAHHSLLVGHPANPVGTGCEACSLKGFCYSYLLTLLRPTQVSYAGSDGGIFSDSGGLVLELWQGFLGLSGNDR